MCWHRWSRWSFEEQTNVLNKAGKYVGLALLQSRVCEKCDKKEIELQTVYV